MPNAIGKIKRLVRGLYPRGRAFKMPIGGLFDKLHNALALSQARAYEDALSTIDAAIADNANFTASDATAWEARLGIINGAGVPLADRVLAINQKLNYPGTNAPRQHYLFIEAELQAAGFNVRIYENKFAGVTQTPEQILGPASGAAFYDPSVYYGSTQYYGGLYNNIVANYIEEAKDADFAIGANYRSTFYVAGATVSTFANVSAARKDEFRQLLLKLKPVQTVGFLFINYI